MPLEVKIVPRSTSLYSLSYLSLDDRFFLTEDLPTKMFCSTMPRICRTKECNLKSQTWWPGLNLISLMWFFNRTSHSSHAFKFRLPHSVYFSVPRQHKACCRSKASVIMWVNSTSRFLYPNYLYLYLCMFIIRFQVYQEFYKWHFLLSKYLSYLSISLWFFHIFTIYYFLL